MNKKPSGMFFEKAAKSSDGRFFNDHPGRDDGAFHEKTAIFSYGPGQIPSGAGAMVSPGGGGMGGMGGGMYGTGKGKKKYGAGDGKSDTPPQETNLKVNATQPSGEETGGGMYGTGKPKSAVPLRSLLNIAGPGKSRPAVKISSAAPSDWDASIGIPTGFHRPAMKQPEPLESGGDRFFSTDAKPAAAGAASGTRHGLVEGGSFHSRGTMSPQMGKHASAETLPQRFLGTSFAKTAETAEDWAGSRGSEFVGSLRRAGETAASKGGEAIKSITQSPGASAIAALIGARLGLGALKRGGRGVARLLGHRPKPAPTMAGQALGGLRKLITGR